MPQQNTKVLKVIGLVFVLIVLVFWFSPFTIITQGERGIVLRLGATQDRVLDEGIHFIIPLMESVIKVDVKTHKFEVDAESFSKDLQTINARIALNFHPEAKNVQKLWQEIGGDYESRIIVPAIQESVKAATAKFTAAELVALRSQVKDEIKNSLIARLGPRYIVVEDFSIMNFSFSAAYEKAIEEKQIAEQRALQAKNDLIRIEVEAQQRIAQAKAEAEAIRIQTEALKQSGELVKLEAVKKWDGVLPKIMMGNGSVPFVDLTQMAQ